MFGPIWLINRTFRGATRPRYRCQTDADRASAGTHLKILVVITSPLWGTFAFVAALAGINQLCIWLDATWHQGPWQAGAITTAAVSLAAAFAAGIRHRRQAQREQAIQEHLSPRVTRYHTCCGLAVNSGHTNTCWTNRQPPPNPAQWSDRR